jgi:hypothetical protein
MTFPCKTAKKTRFSGALILFYSPIFVLFYRGHMQACGRGEKGHFQKKNVLC